jgi:hypothetical protein
VEKSCQLLTEQLRVCRATAGNGKQNMSLVTIKEISGFGLKKFTSPAEVSGGQEKRCEEITPFCLHTDR